MTRSLRTGARATTVVTVGGGSPIWPWTVAAAVVVAVATILALRLGRP